MNTTPNEQLRPQQVCDILNISSKHIYALIKKGKIPANKLTERGMLIKRSDVDAYIASLNPITHTA